MKIVEMIDTRMIPACLMMLSAACAFAAKEEVKVSDFGWDAEDATRYVQAALDSGARRVVFDRQAGPWIVTPLKARSHTEIVFEDGVELVAKRGGFRGVRDSMLMLDNVTNVAIVGHGPRGGIFRMHKADYRVEPYAPSEWRHALALCGAVGVRVENMSFIESGGDGICLGWGGKKGLTHCRDVVVRRCVCDGNLRQGISVASAENLLIEDTVLKGTCGRLPGAGIDFEPDWPPHRIVNCTMRRCRVEGNAGNGVLIWLAGQNGSTRPIGIKVEDCTIEGNGGNGISVLVGGENRHVNPPLGSILFAGCLVTGNNCGSIEVCSKPAGFPLTFADCIVSNQAKGVSFVPSGWNGPMPDGVEFRNLTVHVPNGGGWLRNRSDDRGLNPAVPTNITGEVTLVRSDGRRGKVTLDAAWSRMQFALAGTAELLPERVKRWPDAARCTVHDACPGKMVWLAPLMRKGGWHMVRYAFFADRPGDVHFRVRYVQSVPGPFPAETSMKVGPGRYTHRKKHFAEIPQPGTNSVMFTVAVPARGFHYLVGTAFLTPFLIEEADVPVAVDVHGSVLVLPSAETDCTLGFFVPDGTDHFAVLAKGGPGMDFSAPDGTSAGSLSPSAAWTAFQPKRPVPGLWSATVRRTTARRTAFTLDLTGIPGLIWLSGEKTVSW